MIRAALIATLVFAGASAADPDAPAKPTKPVKHKKRAKPATPQPAPQLELEIDPTPAPAPVEAAAAPLDEPHESATLSADVSVGVTLGPAPGRAPFYVRAGVAFIDPLSSSRPLTLSDVDGPASLAIQNGPIAGSGASVGAATTPAIIVGYRLPYLHHRLSLETVLGLPFTVKFQATGTLANQSIAPTALGIPTGVMALGPELGQAKAAPPVVTAVYELTDGRVKPYVGAGVAVLLSYDAKVTNPTLTEVSQPDMSLAPAPGLVFQGGLEAALTKNIYARIDVKFIALMLANAEVEHIQVRTPDLPLFDTVEVGTAKMSVWVNPLIIQAGIGTDF